MATDTIVKKSQTGRHIEGMLASGQTPKPGQHVSIKSDGTYEAWNGAADGERDEVILLKEDSFLGKATSDAYAASSRFYGHIPVNGDECLVLVASGETVAIGTKLIIDDGTGKCIATTGTPEMEPWKALEASSGALAADTLILCRYTGS